MILLTANAEYDEKVSSNSTVSTVKKPQLLQNNCTTVLLFIGLLLGLTIWTFGGKRQFSYYFHWLTNATIICCVFRQIKRTYICADFVCPSVKHFISFGNIVKSSTVNKHLFSKIYIYFQCHAQFSTDKIRLGKSMSFL